MAHGPRRLVIALALVTASLAAAASWSGAPRAQELAADLVSGVVRLSAEIPPEARTAEALGTRREGSGVVIDDQGLVLTIGYLILEAMSVTVHDAAGAPVGADLVAYDHQSGFGLVRAKRGLGVAPIRFGDSGRLGERAPVLVVPHGGLQAAQPAFVASRRAFTGYWEYLLEAAIFTVPPHPAWSGAALLGSDGRLLGIGSLIVQDALRGEVTLAGNMFVPIDLLKPILADLLSEGRRPGPSRPWLGMFSTDVPGGALVTSVAPEGPAQQAGIVPGDVVVGVAGEAVRDLAELYRKVWEAGAAGVEVALTVRRGAQALDVVITSGNRSDYLRLDPSY